MLVIDRALDPMLAITQPCALDVRSPKFGLRRRPGNEELPTGGRIEIITDESAGGPCGRSNCLLIGAQKES